ncbi:MAG: phosphatase PAP2 family protein [Chloroflexi bacterium]|nr:phosphatase PAP2 family protein [Chloroflexota bacterium]
MRARAEDVSMEAPASATPALASAREVIACALTPRKRNLLHWLSWAVVLSVVSGMTAFLADGQVFGWEQSLTRRAQALGMPDWLFRLSSDSFVDAYAWQGALITLAIIFSLWLFRQRAAAVVLLLVFPLHGLANFPKVLIDRDRPSELFEGIFGVGGAMSFASGHSEFVVTFYGFLVYLALRRLGGQAQRTALVLGWLFFVGLVGFGRVAHGNHWTLDVIVGYVAGLGLLSGLIWLHAALCRVAERRSA